MSKCRECHLEIDWLENSDTGKKMPVNREECCFVEDDTYKSRFLIDGEIVRGYRVGDANEDGYEIGCMVHWDCCIGKGYWIGGERL